MMRSLRLALGIFALMAAYTACTDHCYDGIKNSDEDGIDCGGPCTPCDTIQDTTQVQPTCFDGILNQGELMIDCGGPCGPCPDSAFIPIDTSTAPPVGPQPEPDVCTGNPDQNVFLPLAVGNYWSYVANANYTYTDEVIGQNFLSNGQMYYRMNTSGSALATTFYRTLAASGNVMVWNTDAGGLPVGTEQLYLPGNPTVGQTWTNANLSLTFTVTSIDTSFTAANNCPYTNLLAVSVSNGGKMYFKRGVGPVQVEAGGTAHVLWGVQIN